MPESWINALNKYSYPVRFSDYKRAGEFPGFFTLDVPGDRTSTTEFEDYFRAKSNECIEPYFEVVFWVLCGKSQRFERSVDRIVDHVLDRGIAPSQLRRAVDDFVETPTKRNLSAVRHLLGIKTQVLTVALTFPAFVDPQRYAMMDMKAARWVNDNYLVQSRNRSAVLTPFRLGNTSLRYNDFDDYLNWSHWCRDTAKILTDRTTMEWRARDVEMAVFTASREGLSLNPL
jgi:hypothetical protein